MKVAIKKMVGASACVLAGLGGFAGQAVAQQAGTWQVKAGVNRIAPDVTSGNLSAPSPPNAKVDVDSATSAIVAATYSFTDMWSVEVYAGLPYKHDIVGDGSLAGFGKIGSIKQISPTAFLQYRFKPISSIRPFVGLGVTYAYFYDEEGSQTLDALNGGVPVSLNVDPAWGLSPQVGVALDFAPNWFVEAVVVKTWLKTTTSLSSGQRIDTKLDPWSTSLAVGYRF